jgi:hypothetical protein
VAEATLGAVLVDDVGFTKTVAEWRSLCQRLADAMGQWVEKEKFWSI